MLRAENICKKYGPIEVLKNITLSINHSEIVSVVGASGAGKSSLLHIMGTLDKPDAGQVWLNDQNLQELSERELAKIRNQKMGFIFQFHNLMAELTAFENICLPAWVGQQEKMQTTEKAHILMEALKIEHRAKHLPSEMSGGEQQRVAVARAVINSPAYVFADEPSGNLDTKNAEQLHHLFFDLRNKFGCSFVIVTHNAGLAEMSDRRIELIDGQTGITL